MLKQARRPQGAARAHRAMPRARPERRRTPARGVLDRGATTAAGRPLPPPPPGGRAVMPTRCSGSAPPATCGAAGSTPYGDVPTPAAAAVQVTS